MDRMLLCSCAPPQGTSPDRGRGARRARRWALLACSALLAACSRQARAVRLPTPNAGEVLYRITCRQEIEQCRAKADSVCAGEFSVLHTTGNSVEPPRVSSAPGPRSTGSRYQRPDWLGELVVACGQPPEPAPLEAAPAPAATPSTLAPGQLCIPGITQACLGPGACRGAQACLPDGRGFGACDCGTPGPGSADAGVQR
jgi:hypothetical protein